jgi:hypothetical protein
MRDGAQVAIGQTDGVSLRPRQSEPVQPAGVWVANLPVDLGCAASRSGTSVGRPIESWGVPLSRCQGIEGLACSALLTGPLPAWDARSCVDRLHLLPISSRRVESMQVCAFTCRVGCRVTDTILLGGGSNKRR